MSIRKTVSKGFSKVFSPTQWLGMESIKENGKVIGNLLKSAFYIRPETTEEGRTFEACLKHYGVSEAELKKRMASALQVVWFCMILATLLLPYAFYLFFQTQFIAGIVALVMMFVLLAYAFRDHFQYYQMKERRLGCTFKEWFHFVLKGSK